MWFYPPLLCHHLSGVVCLFAARHCYKSETLQKKQKQHVLKIMEGISYPYIATVRNIITGAKMFRTVRL